MAEKIDFPVMLGFLFPIILIATGILMIKTGFDTFFPFIFIITGVITGLIFSFVTLNKYGKENKLW